MRFLEEFAALLLIAALAIATPSAAGTQAQDQLVLESLAGKVETRSAAAVGDLRFAADSTVFLRFDGVRPEPPRVQGHVDLGDGQRWCGEVAGGGGDQLRWRTGLGPVLALSIDHVTSLEFPERVTGVDRAGLEAPREGDRLYWVHGEALERVDGTFEAFSDAGVALDSVLGKRVFPWAEVGALFITPLEGGTATPPVSGTPLVLDLVDGSRVRAGFQSANPKGLLLNYPGLESLTVPFHTLVEAALEGPFLYLSSLKPSKAMEGSLFGDELGLRWPHRVDRSVVGTRLSVGDQPFTRGIGVHAPSRLEWDLSALATAGTAFAARELTGMVGIDDSVRSTAARGSVRFQVFVDGTSRWDSGVVRGGEAAKAMPRIDLRNAKVLALVVDPAEESFIADRADWLKLVLVRAP